MMTEADPTADQEGLDWLLDGEVDTPTLEAALGESIPEAMLGEPILDTEVLHDGLNLSVAITTEHGDPAFVLRRPNKFRDREAFNDIADEYRVMERLADTDIPAPEPVYLGEDESVMGAPFLVMSYVSGETIPLGSDLPPRYRTPGARRQIASLLIDTLADLHRVDTGPFEDVCRREPIGEQVDRIIDQLDAATSVTEHEPQALMRVADWLQDHVPASSEPTLVHGDYRPGNVLFTGEETPELSGVIDWEVAFLGDPLVELGYLLLRWRDEGDPTPALDEIESLDSGSGRFLDLAATNRDGLAPFTAEVGSPTRLELVARYEERTGRPFENERFYRAFAAFVLATVWADLHRHQVEHGGDSSWKPDIEFMALLAASIVDGEFPL